MIVQPIPEWLLRTVVIVCLVLFFGLLAGALLLEIQYTGPFTLLKTSDREKWRRAAILAALQTAIIPIVGIAALIIGPSHERWFYILFCNGLWMVVLPLAVLFKRSKLERQIEIYKRRSKRIKEGDVFYYRMHRTAEQRRFLREGFPDDLEKKSDNES